MIFISPRKLPTTARTNDVVINSITEQEKGCRIAAALVFCIWENLFAVMVFAAEA